MKSVKTALGFLVFVTSFFVYAQHNGDVLNRFSDVLPHWDGTFGRKITTDAHQMIATMDWRQDGFTPAPRDGATSWVDSVECYTTSPNSNLVPPVPWEHLRDGRKNLKSFQTTGVLCLMRHGNQAKPFTGPNATNILTTLTAAGVRSVSEGGLRVFRTGQISCTRGPVQVNNKCEIQGIR